jgi:hypothetical protein
MNRIILAALLLFVSAANADYPDYENTDKIHLYVLGKNDERHEEKFIVDGHTVTVFIKIDLENITQVDFIDVSTAIECRDWKPSPPSTIASYKVAPNETTNLKEVWFHMRLPCGAYHDSFYYVIQVKTLQGNYYSRKKFPAKIKLRPGRGGTTP